MTKRQGPTLRAQWLGQQLRDLRESGGITLKQVAEYLERDPSTVSRFESAEYPLRRVDLLGLLEFYAVEDPQRREALLTLREEVWRRGFWWDAYAEAFDPRFIDYVWLESRARLIQCFANTLLPGLLQTSRYALAAIRAAVPDLSSDQLDRAVEIRIARQQVLANENPPQLHAILDEALLRRVVDNSDTMREQLRHLLACAERPNIEIRVLPFAAGAHASPNGEFKVFTMAEPYPDVAYTETLTGGSYIEAPVVERYTHIYDQVVGGALSPAASVEVISAAMEEFR